MEKKKKNLQYPQLIHHHILLQLVLLLYFQYDMVELMVDYLMI